MTTKKGAAPELETDEGPPLVRPKRLTGRPETLRQDQVPDLIPARMLNELAFCPRLFAIEWVDGLWKHNAHTVEGAIRHEGVDAKRKPRSGVAAVPGVDGETTSLLLSSERLGLTAKLDRVLVEGTRATPIEHKKGRAPQDRVAIPPDLLCDTREMPEDSDDEVEVEPAAEAQPTADEADIDDGAEAWGLGPSARAWWPDQVQVGVQALLLEEAGFEVPTALIYYAAERRRVSMPITQALKDAVLALAARARTLAAAPTLPPPLESSPKCTGCSLQPICLPDEVSAADDRARADDPDPEPLRRILAARDDEIPLYVVTQGAYVRKVGEVLRVEFGSERLDELPIRLARQVCLFGNVQITTQTVGALAAAEIPLVYLSRSGKFVAITTGMPLFNVMLRKAQFERLADPEVVVRLASGVVAAKIHNQRALLMRNGENVPDAAIDGMKRAAVAAEQANSLDEVRGHEGAAASLYFGSFSRMLRGSDDGSPEFDFETRNRRPPKDPINAMLSFGYALLTKELTATCLAVGLDPLLGALHSPAFRRPALALDLMEEWRALIVDSTVITLVNNRMVTRADFWVAGGACEMKDGARRAFLDAYEKRLQTLVTHPLFGYRLAYRRALEVQVRLFGRLLAGEITHYPGFRTR